jgi:hypothetical protein
MPRDIKVTFNDDGLVASGGLITGTLIQNSGNFNYIYIYGLPADLTIGVSYTRPDGFPIGPIAADYGYDTAETPVYCVIARIPKEALAVAGGLYISIVASEEVTETVEGVETTTTVQRGFADIVATIAANRAVVGL